MNTLVALAPKIYPIVYKMWEADKQHWYGLQGPVDYGRIQTSRFPAFNYQDDIFLVEKVDEDTAHWWLQSFTPDTHYWDGTSNLPDKGTKSLDAMLRASLFHDCGYAKAEAISKATGIPVKEILAFFDDCFKLLAEGYGASKKVTGPVHWFLRTGGNLYHQVMKLFAVVLVVLLAGCYSVKVKLLDPPPDINFTGPFTQEQINEQYED